MTDHTCARNNSIYVHRQETTNLTQLSSTTWFAGTLNLLTRIGLLQIILSSVTISLVTSHLVLVTIVSISYSIIGLHAKFCLNGRPSMERAHAAPTKISKSQRVTTSTWMGEHKRRPCTVNLCPFVRVDLNL